MNGRFEVVNKKDGSRMSHTAGNGSSTVFLTKRAAVEWCLEMGLEEDQYSIEVAA